MFIAAGCGSEPADEAAPENVATTAASPSPTADAAELRAELLAMLEEDQAERTGESTANSDRARAARLAEIVEEHGWPLMSVVGEDGATATWAIVQHADHDVEFQERMLELMAAAAAAGEADTSQLAFLEDRVAVNQGRPQTYGSQMGCVDGEAVPAPIADEDGIDARRAEVGLEPLADYLAQFAEACAAEE